MDALYQGAIEHASLIGFTFVVAIAAISLGILVAHFESWAIEAAKAGLHRTKR